MLEIINVIGNHRQGEAKLDYASAYQGYVVYIKGVDSEGTVLVSCPNSSAQAAKTYYPIKKLRFEEDLSDTSNAVDKLNKGDRVIYYEGGEFQTDKFSRKSLNFSKVGLTATAAARGVDTVVTTVAPGGLGLYPTYWGANRGMLTATAVGTSAAMLTMYGTNVKKFVLSQAWLSSPESNLVPNISIRFKVVPGVLVYNV
jgi:hypothetical protein